VKPSPKRIQLRRTKGWKKPRNTVVVARPSKWGNIWKVGTHGNREFCFAQFAQFFPIGCLSITPAMAKAELRGKNLACWCKLPKPREPDVCHAAVLLEVSNR
jgi:hypothetical protein